MKSKNEQVEREAFALRDELLKPLTARGYDEAAMTAACHVLAWCILENSKRKYPHNVPVGICAGSVMAYNIVHESAHWYDGTAQPHA